MLMHYLNEFEGCSGAVPLVLGQVVVLVLVVTLLVGGHFAVR